VSHLLRATRKASTGPVTSRLPITTKAIAVPTVCVDDRSFDAIATAPVTPSARFFGFRPDSSAPRPRAMTGEVRSSVAIHVGGGASTQGRGRLRNWWSASCTNSSYTGSARPTQDAVLRTVLAADPRPARVELDGSATRRVTIAYLDALDGLDDDLHREGVELVVTPDPR
jgi:hypothetical protein